MGEVKDWKWVVVGLGVPHSKQDKIEGQSSTDGEKGRVLGAYWVNTDPDASWKKLARVLYWNREERAISITKQYLPKGTLSLSNPELNLYHQSYLTDLHVWLLHQSIHVHNCYTQA